LAERDGSLRPGDLPYLTGDGNRFNRGMAYDAVTGHLIVVNRDPAGESVNAVDAAAGTNLLISWRSNAPGYSSNRRPI